jgi:hypothetical protein
MKRVEDARLLSGRGRFIDDHDPCAGVHAAAIVRSPHPHARITGYDVAAALAMEGVVGVVTGADVARHPKLCLRLRRAGWTLTAGGRGTSGGGAGAEGVDVDYLPGGARRDRSLAPPCAPHRGSFESFLRYAGIGPGATAAAAPSLLDYEHSILAARIHWSLHYLRMEHIACPL